MWRIGITNAEIQFDGPRWPIIPALLPVLPRSTLLCSMPFLSFWFPLRRQWENGHLLFFFWFFWLSLSSFFSLLFFSQQKGLGDESYRIRIDQNDGYNNNTGTIFYYYSFFFVRIHLILLMDQPILNRQTNLEKKNIEIKILLWFYYSIVFNFISKNYY